MAEDPIYYIQEIERAREFMKKGVYARPNDENDGENEYIQDHAMEIFQFAIKLIGMEGPIKIDTNIIKHAYGLYNEDELKQLYPTADEKNDLIIVGVEGKEIEVQDVDDFFEKLLNSTWIDGRSYWLNGIYSSHKYRWVGKHCDYAINWDS